MSDNKYKDLFGDQPPSDAAHHEPQSLKNRRKEQGASKLWTDAEDEDIRDPDTSSAPSLKDRHKVANPGKKNNGKDTYSNLFGNESDIQTANSEFGGSFSAAAYEDIPTSNNHSNPEILTGERQADYIPSQTDVQVSRGSKKLDTDINEDRRKNGQFINLPLLWQRLLIVALLFAFGTWLYYHEVAYVDESGRDSKAGIYDYMTVFLNMDREQSALQGTDEEERPLIMTRIRMEQLYSIVLEYTQGVDSMPTSFEALEEKGYDTEKLKTDGWDMPLIFERVGGDIQVRSVGPDRMDSTKDDIKHNLDGLYIPPQVFGAPEPDEFE